MSNQPPSELDSILNLYRRGIERHYGGRTVGKTLTEDEAKQRITALLVRERFSALDDLDTDAAGQTTAYLSVALHAHMSALQTQLKQLEGEDV